MKLGSARKRFLIPAAAALVIAAAVAFVPGVRRAFTGSGAAGAAGVAAASEGQPAGSTDAAGKDSKSDEKKKEPIPVSVAAIETGTVSSYIISTANLIPEDEVKILAEVEGRVAELFVEEGDRVVRGQALASLAREDAEITHRKSELKAANARLAHERAGRVVAENLLSREDFDRIALDDDVAQQEVAEARWRLDRTTIRAPFTGRVTERILRAGQHVRPGDTLFTVADFDPLIAWIYLPEKEVLDLDEGRAVRITLKADESTRFSGRVRQISPVVDRSTGTVKVTVEALAPPAKVRPGAFVTIEIVRETRTATLLLPREAVIRELQDAFVFVARGEVAEKRVVSLGLEEGGRTEALSGVTAGERVIVAGQGGLKDGTPIKVIPAADSSSLVSLEGHPLEG